MNVCFHQCTAVHSVELKYYAILNQLSCIHTHGVSALPSISSLHPPIKAVIQLIFSPESFCIKAAVVALLMCVAYRPH